MSSLCSKLSSHVPFTSNSLLVRRKSWLITVFILPVDDASITKSVKYYLHCNVYLQKGILGCDWIYLGNISFVTWKFDLISCRSFPSLLLPKVCNSEENIISIYWCNQTKRFCCKLREDCVPDGNSKFNYWQWNEYRMFLHAQSWTMHCFKARAACLLQRCAGKS